MNGHHTLVAEEALRPPPPPRTKFHYSSRISHFLTRYRVRLVKYAIWELKPIMTIARDRAL